MQLPLDAFLRESLKFSSSPRLQLYPGAQSLFPLCSVLANQPDLPQSFGNGLDRTLKITGSTRCSGRPVRRRIETRVIFFFFPFPRTKIPLPPLSGESPGVGRHCPCSSFVLLPERSIPRKNHVFFLFTLLKGTTTLSPPKTSNKNPGTIWTPLDRLFTPTSFSFFPFFCSPQK